MSDFDAIIIGGGPAGSSAAIHLAASGARVLVAEQKRFPREKLCGEFISPECLEHFARLGVLERMTLAGGAQVSQTVFYAPSGRGLTVPSAWFGGGALRNLLLPRRLRRPESRRRRPEQPLLHRARARRARAQ